MGTLNPQPDKSISFCIIEILFYGKKVNDFKLTSSLLLLFVFQYPKWLGEMQNLLAKPEFLLVFS